MNLSGVYRVSFPKSNYRENIYVPCFILIRKGIAHISILAAHFEKTRFRDPGLLPPLSSSPLPAPVLWRLPETAPSISAFAVGDENALLETPPLWTRAQQESLPCCTPPPRVLFPMRHDARSSSQSLVSSWLRRSRVAISTSIVEPPVSISATTRGRSTRSRQS